MSDTSRSIILASTSRYRADLLRRLGLDFVQRASRVDETEHPGESASARALRLAIAKAAAIETLDEGIIIGSDQVSSLHGVIQHKPEDGDCARAQLRASSGQVVMFHTAVCVRDSRDNRHRTHVDQTNAYFRSLDEPEIQRYVEREQPLDCAGSFKCESLGIALFTHVDTRDPTALIGLPLIALANMLRACGVALP